MGVGLYMGVGPQIELRLMNFKRQAVEFAAEGPEGQAMVVPPESVRTVAASPGQRWVASANAVRAINLRTLLTLAYSHQNDERC